MGDEDEVFNECLRAAAKKVVDENDKEAAVQKRRNEMDEKYTINALDENLRLAGAVVNMIRSLPK